MSLENIFNWMWSTNILIVLGAIVLFIIGFYFLEAILSFIFSKWILIVIALIASFLFSNYYFQTFLLLKMTLWNTRYQGFSEGQNRCFQLVCNYEKVSFQLPLIAGDLKVLFLAILQFDFGQATLAWRTKMAEREHLFTKSVGKGEGRY